MCSSNKNHDILDFLDNFERERRIEDWEKLLQKIYDLLFTQFVRQLDFAVELVTNFVGVKQWTSENIARRSQLFAKLENVSLSKKESMRKIPEILEIMSFGQPSDFVDPLIVEQLNVYLTSWYENLRACKPKCSSSCKCMHKSITKFCRKIKFDMSLNTNENFLELVFEHAFNPLCQLIYQILDHIDTQIIPSYTEIFSKDQFGLQEFLFMRNIPFKINYSENQFELTVGNNSDRLKLEEFTKIFLK